MDNAINLIGGDSGIDAVLSRHFFNEIALLHAPKQ
jgi:hypothetical protein